MNLIDRLKAEHVSARDALEALHLASEKPFTAPVDPMNIPAVDESLGVVCAIVHGHAQAEEELIFPLFKTQNPSLFEKLTNEHRRALDLYEKVRQAFDADVKGLASDREGWAVPLEELRGLLSAHMQRENLMVFPRAEQLPQALLAPLEGR